MLKYDIRYTLDLESRPDGYTKEDVLSDRQGLTDKFLLASVLKEEDGSSSTQIIGMKKDKKELTPEEIFEFWVLLGASLHDEKKLDGWQKDYVELHTKTMRYLVSNGEIIDG